ncbi:glycosyltransferase family 4 protein [Cognatishimia activa]|uniref:Glycogen synthase n=1 Tax=Cognatishimia activa TaxID=1715691 RepID=A0A0P1ISE3_9RHOB|nr:glycosyltransferase family 4 protein [Cognatishimia activa]CUI67786.1 Glycogen synthase [Cognatishimia activa]CUK26487.1 Glycogen synthase [Cognatishimia activa]
MKPTITHLLDDATSGGVTRVIDFMQSSEALNAKVDQNLQMVPARGRWPQFEGDMIISHLSVNWRNLPALMALRAMHPNATLVHVEHSYTQRFTALNVPNKDRFYTLLRTAYALFDQVVCVSRSQGSWMATRALVDSTKLRIIRSAVDLTDFAKLPPVSGTPRCFGLLGRLHQQKGFDLAIAAFRQLSDPNLRLKIFGIGEDQKLLRRMAKGDSRISFEGFSANPSQAMQSIDALLVPSRWEAYGLVAQEALAAGRPVLVAPVDGLTDQVQDGATQMTGIGVSALASDLERIANGTEKPAIAKQSAFAMNSKNRFETDWLRLFDEAFAMADAAA